MKNYVINTKKIPYFFKGIIIGLILVLIQAILFFGCAAGIKGEGAIACNIFALPVFMISFSGVFPPPDIPSYDPSWKEKGLSARYTADGVHYVRYGDAEFFVAKEEYNKKLNRYYYKLIVFYSLIVVLTTGFIGSVVQFIKDSKKREI